MASSMTVLEERDNVLQELLNTVSLDLSKLNITDIVLRYFESKRLKKVTVDPWSYSAPAVRQLTSARKSALRNDYFRRAKPPVTREASSKAITEMLIEQQREDRRRRLEKLRELQMQALQEEHEQQVARQLAFQTVTKRPSNELPAAPLDQATKGKQSAPSTARSASVMSSGSERSISQLSEVAQQLVEHALTYASIEREISCLAQNVVNNAIARSEVDTLLSSYVTELIVEAVERSKSTVSSTDGERLSMIAISAQERERIEAISREIVAQVIMDAVAALEAHKSRREN